jgi:hypothetical protein
MKKIGKFLFLYFIFCSLNVFAKEFQVEASVDRNQMGIGDSFTLSLRVSGDEDFDIEEPKIPHVTGLELLNSWQGGRQSSSSMSMINGKASFSKSVSQTYNYQFSPQKEGSFSIPVVDVKISGQNYKTNPIKIDVAEEYRNSARSKNKNGASRPNFPPGFGDDEEASPFSQEPDAEDLFSQLMKQRQRMFGQLPNQGRAFGGGAGQGQQIQNRKLNIDMNEAFFVWLDLDKTEVYEGEQITANWSIYTRGNLETLDRVKFPDLKGFWKEIIEEVPSLQFVPEMVNGVLYNKALLASHALFPIRAGQAVIDEFKVKGRIRNQTQFGWGQPHEFTKNSKRTTIKVLPLPTDGKTIHFSGAVGSYRITVKTDGNTFPAQQPFSLKVRFEGIGNAKLIDLPNIQWPEGLEVFDTKNESKFYKDGQSYKEFEILAIPRKEGEMNIPSLNFSYFDPTQKKYVTQSSEEIKLMITPGSAQSSNTTSTKAKTAETAVSEAVFKAQPILELPQSSFAFSELRLLFYAVLALLVLLATSAQFFWKLKNFEQEPGFRKLVETKIKWIDQQKDQRKVGAESVNLIYLLAAYLAGQKKANQEWSQLIKDIPLKSQGIYLDRLTKLFDYFQLLGFSPENVVTQLLKTHPVNEQITQLKKISEEISVQAKLEEQV